MKKLNLNPSTQKERLELEEKKWAIEKIIVSLTVILALFSWLFNVKTVALFFFVALIYELFFVQLHSIFTTTNRQLIKLVIC